ncbi:hypothetical protein ISS07_03825 [Candidatus Woesearchaeota archaeon]|nr:hypothetical protein [Candidatus Woesearchaeota archaeon]
MEKIKIQQEKNEVLVSFNEKFYKEDAINQAIADFKQACDIKKNENGLLMKPKGNIDIDTLGYEFYNYVLGLMKNK